MEEILENEGLDISSFLDVKELAQSRLVFGMLILHELLECDGMLSLNNSQERKAFQN